VIVGTQNSVAQGPSFAQALQALFNTTQPIPGLPNPSTTPGTTTTPPTATTPPSTANFTGQELALLNDLLTHEQNAQAALQKGDFTTFGKEEDAVKSDTAQLTALLQNQKAVPSASPSPRPSPTP
jgi:uncharacterized membrane protein (UPF0182 family)